MRFKITEVDVDANNKVAVKVDYIKNGVIIKDVKYYENTETQANIVKDIKSTSPSDDTLEEEATKLAEETKTNSLIEKLTTDLIGVVKTFDPANFNNEEL